MINCESSALFALRDVMQSNVVIVSILLGRAECVRYNPGILE